MKPIRLRDFIEDTDGWIYAVSVYDNACRVGCVLRYVPDPQGERVDASGHRYRKLDFDEAFALIDDQKPRYADLVQRVPLADVRRVLKPEIEFPAVLERDERVRRLVALLGVPEGLIGATGSLLCGLEGPSSDIDLVVYGKAWFAAQASLRRAVEGGVLPGLSEETWRKVYAKRVPEIDYETFVLHEQRKWNRGQVDGTYFDLLFTRDYYGLPLPPSSKGEVLGRRTIEAPVTEASLSFDSPAVYEVEHETVSKVLSFTHTYSGQALAGELIEARGVLERHADECWLVVGTTREARGEYIISKTLLEQY
jgi:predicted nucleotidyltransferase